MTDQPSPLCFTLPTVDRMADLRRDPDGIARRLQDPSTRFLPLWKLKHLFVDGPSPHAGTFTPAEVSGLVHDPESVFLLGANNGTTYFALNLPPESDPFAAHSPAAGTFRDLKTFGTLVSQSEGSLLAYSRALVHWHETHRFCGACGSPTRVALAGHERVCDNGDCGRRHYPRTDPAVIVLAVAGDRCLLGRQASWVNRMYSAIAGFVEPGETVEAAVAREVMEETGVRVKSVRYHSSQPWPFPASVMLGFFAEAEPDPIRLHDHELEDAQWFSRKELEDALIDGTVRFPGKISIAYELMKEWFDAAGEPCLEQFLASKR